MNLPSCPRCHLYLSARGCTPERCANPEGAAELERLRGLEGCPPSEATPAYAAAMRVDRSAKPAPSDLDTFRAMLERAGIKLAVDAHGWTGSYVSLHFAPDGTLTKLCDPADGHEGGACPYCGL